MATVTFLGACGCVTGSSTLLSWGDTSVLVDCGLFQGDEELEQRNWNPFPFPPSKLDAVLLTHAHLDHTGLLPRLASQGFSGPVYCTRPSRGLISLVLLDSAKIQEEEVRYARRKGYSRHVDPQPLYTRENSRRALKLLHPVPFDEEHELVPGVRFRYSRVGHLLGAASLEVSAKGSDGARRTWCFSGDVGRYGVPILKDPESPPDPPAALVLESTYGDRCHPKEDPAAVLETIINATFSRGGMVIIPAFALGRTQDVLWHLSSLVERGRLDRQAVFLDSPMAIDATDLYDRAEVEHDEDLLEVARSRSDPLAPTRFQRCYTADQSRSLNARQEPAVLVASSGMATGGRVLHHLLHRLPDPQSSVVFVGFQAAGTRGRALVGGAETVAIHGEAIRVRAQIHQIQSMSSHADQSELVDWCQALPGRPERIFLNHGEDSPRKALRVALGGLDGWPLPHLPLTGERVPW